MPSISLPQKTSGVVSGPLTVTGNAVLNGSQGLYIKGPGPASPLTDTSVPLQISSGTTGTESYFGANKNGAYGFLLGYCNRTDQTFPIGGVMRMVTADSFSFVMNNTTVAATFAASGALTLYNTLTIPAASPYVWSGRAKLTSPADGFVQVLSNAGGNLATFAMGLMIGTDTSLIRSAAGRLRTMNANQTTNTALEAANFFITNNGMACGWDTQGTGLVINSFSSVDLYISGATALNIDSSKVVTLAAAIRTANLAADPTGTSVVKGAVYYNTGSNKLKVYTGSAWETVTSA